MARIGDLSKDLQDFSNSYPADDRIMKRGEIYYIDLEGIGYGSRYVQTKTRPGIIIQNDVGNQRGETVIIALLTTSIKKDYPFQYRFSLNGRDSAIMFEQIMTLDKFRILEKCGELSSLQMREAEARLMYSLQLNVLSFDNVIDFDIESISTKRTRSGTASYVGIEFKLKKGQSIFAEVPLNKLSSYNKEIMIDSSFDDIKRALNSCEGLHVIASNYI